MDKTKVLMIKLSDGQQINLWETEDINKQKAQVTPTSQPSTASVNIDVSDPKRNAELIARYNTEPEIIFKKEKDRKKKANAVYIKFAALADSKFCSTAIEVSCYINNKNANLNTSKQKESDFFNKGVNTVVNTDYSLSVTFEIKNRSNKTIYIDLSNTFFSQNGESVSYYVPSYTSTSKGTDKGVGVNIGIVASAVGVGGAIGTIANGVNVGGSKITTTTTTVINQQTISIPPQSKISLGPQKLSNISDCDGFSTMYNSDRIIYRNISLGSHVGDIIKWDKDQSPYNFSCFVTYADNSYFENNDSLNTIFYMNECITCNYSTFSYEQIPEFNDTQSGISACFKLE